jgi:hypothetical protein
MSSSATRSTLVIPAAFSPRESGEGIQRLLNERVQSGTSFTDETGHMVYIFATHADPNGARRSPDTTSLSGARSVRVKSAMPEANGSSGMVLPVKYRG